MQDIINNFVENNLNIVQLEYFIRILLAGICGAIIGLERRKRFKDAGIRTHLILAIGCAVIMIVSKYAFVPMKKDIFGCLFSVIFVPYGTSDIYFVSDIALRAVLKKGEYNITKAEGFNITLALLKYHSVADRISLYTSLAKRGGPTRSVTERWWRVLAPKGAYNKIIYLVIY